MPPVSPPPPSEGGAGRAEVRGWARARARGRLPVAAASSGAQAGRAGARDPPRGPPRDLPAGSPRDLPATSALPGLQVGSRAPPRWDKRQRCSVSKGISKRGPRCPRRRESEGRKGFSFTSYSGRKKKERGRKAKIEKCNNHPIIYSRLQRQKTAIFHPKKCI